MHKISCDLSIPLFSSKMVEQHLISDLATIVKDYSLEMWQFSTGEERYLYRSHDAALKYACEWLYKNINVRLGDYLYRLTWFFKDKQDWFVVGEDGGLSFVIRVKETLQNDYDKLCAIYTALWGVKNPVIEQLYYSTKD